LVVLLGGRLFMKLAVEIDRSAVGEHVSNARQSGVYTNGWQ
jgi:hypothetical protein